MKETSRKMKKPPQKMEAHARAVRKYYAAGDFERAFAHYRHVLMFGAAGMIHVTLRSKHDVAEPRERRYRVAEIDEVSETETKVAADLFGRRIATVVPCDPLRPLGKFVVPGSGTVIEIDDNQINTESGDYTHRVVSMWLAVDQNREGAVELASKVGLEHGRKNRTHQGVNYAETTTREDGVMGPRVYADAWCFSNVTLLGPREYRSSLVFCPVPDKSHVFYRDYVAWATYTALYACATKMDIEAVILPWMHEHYKTDVVNMIYHGILPDQSRVPTLETRFSNVIITRPSAPVGSYAAAGPSARSGQLVIHSMGILGLRPSENGRPDVPAHHALVDPAGLDFIKKNNPGGAEHLSRALYDFVGIKRFHRDVQEGITNTCDAVYHKYEGGRHVIHVVGPDFRKERNIMWHDAVAVLKRAYANVLNVAEDLPSEVGVIRIPLVSGGVFAGKFKAACVPELTARAVVAAMSEVESSRKKLRKVYWLCTFTEPEDTALYQRAYDLARSVRHYDYKNVTFPRTAPTTSVTARSVAHEYGTVGYAVDLWSKRDKTASKVKIGVMVAANSGRPGGSIGKALEDIPTIEHGAVTRGFNGELETQEESVVSEWLYGECNDNSECGERLFRSTICGLWGQMERQVPRTIQGVDYTKAAAAEYGDAWVVRDANLRSRGRANTVTATLVFVAGPNAQSKARPPQKKGDYGSMYYTANRSSANSYDEFKKGVEASVRAGLLAMQAEGVTHALVAYVSGGIYAGNHKRQIRDEFGRLVGDVASAIGYDATIVIVDRTM